MKFYRKLWKAFIGVILISVVLGLLYFSVFCGQNSVCVFNKESSNHLPEWQFDSSVINREYQLDLDNEDVLVFLHIQKTGGTTFGRHLVNNLDLDSPCLCNNKKGRKKKRKQIKKCQCLTKNKTLWLFSRYSTGWACGLHADWTELKNCVEQAMDKQEGIHRTRRFHYISILREPAARYISEWRHVKRGATWKTAALKCNGRQATLEEVPFCYDGETWEGVDIQSFLDCKYNLANNRQTRMLSNLSKVNCYNTSGMTEKDRNEVMLQSAKENLLNLDFFGLTEFQKDTQLLFEHTFHIQFIKDFSQINSTHSQKTQILEEEMEEVLKKNTLDVELYKFAKELFIQRVKNMKEEKSEDNENVEISKIVHQSNWKDWKLESAENMENMKLEKDRSNLFELNSTSS